MTTLVLLLLSIPAAAQQDKPWRIDGDTRPGIAKLDASLGGLVGDSRLGGKHVQSVLPDVGGSFGFVGKGPALSQTLPRLKPLKKLGPSSFVRAQMELDVAGMTQDGKTNGLIGGQARLGIGKILKNGIYYMATGQIDYMFYTGTYHKGAEPFQDSDFRLYGGELGKELRFGKNGVVYAGVTAGVGNYAGINGQEIGPDGKERWRMFSYWRPGAGVSVEGRLGKPNTKGTVTFSATTQSYAKANRSNLSVDYNVGRKTKVGAGFRQSFIEDKDSANPPGIDLLVPYLKVAYGVSR